VGVLDELFSGDDARADAALAEVEPGLLPRLQAALTDDDADRRWWAVRALAQLDGAEATRALLGALGDADPAVRAAAAHALGLRKAPEAVPPLLNNLADPSEYLARLAADALIGIGPEAVPGLVERLQSDANPRVRGNAARALAAIGDKRAIPVLFEALSDDSAVVQYWAEEGLERLGAGQVYFKP
jgi:HEAT repeat protein